MQVSGSYGRCSPQKVIGLLQGTDFLKRRRLYAKIKLDKEEGCKGRNICAGESQNRFFCAGKVLKDEEWIKDEILAIYKG